MGREEVTLPPLGLPCFGHTPLTQEGQVRASPCPTGPPTPSLAQRQQVRRLHIPPSFRLCPLGLLLTEGIPSSTTGRKRWLSCRCLFSDLRGTRFPSSGGLGSSKSNACEFCVAGTLGTARVCVCLSVVCSRSPWLLCVLPPQRSGGMGIRWRTGQEGGLAEQGGPGDSHPQLPPPQPAFLSNGPATSAILGTVTFH